MFESGLRTIPMKIQSPCIWFFMSEIFYLSKYQ